MSAIEYFELKYLEEINSLFKECLEIEKAYNITIRNNFMDIFDLIYENVEIMQWEEDEDEENKIYDTNNEL